HLPVPGKEPHCLLLADREAADTVQLGLVDPAVRELLRLHQRRQHRLHPAGGTGGSAGGRHQPARAEAEAAISASRSVLASRMLAQASPRAARMSGTVRMVKSVG